MIVMDIFTTVNPTEIGRLSVRVCTLHCMGGQTVCDRVTTVETWLDNSFTQETGVFNQLYDKYVLACDSNAEEEEEKMGNFLDIYGLKCLVHDKTCFKSVIKPSCIDLFLTNSSNSFQNIYVICSGLSDCHTMVLILMKTNYPNAKPRKLFYRNYKNFSNAGFNNDLKLTPLTNNNTCNNFSKFQDIFLIVLDRYAPMKQKYIRANEVPYMTKTLRKDIMTRSRLQKRFYKTNSVEDKANV